MKSTKYIKYALIAQGIILIGMGLYFISVRPSLLPEDFAYIGTDEGELGENIPRLYNWLDKVFAVLGGYIVSSGLLFSHLGFSMDQVPKAGSIVVIFLAGTFSIGLMTVVNFIIDSDFKWLLTLFNIPWMFSLATVYSIKQHTLQSIIND